MAKFELNGVTYNSNDKGTYFYKGTGTYDKKGNELMRRISKDIYEKAFDEYVKTAEDHAVTDARENEKKAKRVRRPKDVAFEAETIEGTITLTDKQVDFLKHLPETSFWDNGIESILWCDCLADEIGGQFAGKPMTVGAMISTLREKKLLEVGRDESRQGKPKYMTLTIVGQVVAQKLGVK